MTENIDLDRTFSCLQHMVELMRTENRKELLPIMYGSKGASRKAMLKLFFGVLHNPENSIFGNLGPLPMAARQDLVVKRFVEPDDDGAVLIGEITCPFYDKSGRPMNDGFISYVRRELDGRHTVLCLCVTNMGDH